MAPIPFIASDVQTMLRDALRRWGGTRDVREAEDFDTVWQFAADQGWLMAGMAEELGGLGGNVFDTAIVAEEFGRVLIRAPYAEVAVVAARLLAEIAPERVGAILEGKACPVLAHDEPAARGDPAWVETQAGERGGSWHLTGRKTGVIGTGHADSFLVSARIGGEGIGLFEVPAAEAPLKCFTTFDSRSGGELALDDTPATLLARPAIAELALFAALDHALVLESAEMIGAMDHAQELTRDYILTRKQYGQAIGDFQALRHRIADMFIESEQARSIVLRGLAALAGGELSERAAMAAAVKAHVAEAALFVCGNAIQLHGGIGMTDEYPVGHFYKRALAFAQRHGGAARQVERFAELSGSLR
ncbi:MAG: acyl-CoA dehydrogenase [Novosphingobium sp.]|nr:acyl-CoA dehydrogenase [Novosphingobium sp.]